MAGKRALVPELWLLYILFTKFQHDHTLKHFIFLKEVYFSIHIKKIEQHSSSNSFPL